MKQNVIGSTARPLHPSNEDNAQLQVQKNLKLLYDPGVINDLRKHKTGEEKFDWHNHYGSVTRYFHLENEEFWWVHVDVRQDDGIYVTICRTVTMTEHFRIKSRDNQPEGYGLAITNGNPENDDWRYLAAALATLTELFSPNA